MKTRFGFVSNSSSTSFMIMMAGITQDQHDEILRIMEGLSRDVDVSYYDEGEPGEMSIDISFDRGRDDADELTDIICYELKVLGVRYIIDC